MENLKFFYNYLIGLAGSLLITVYGGWTSGLSTLLTFVAIDFILGIIVSCLFKKSRKTKNGKFDYTIGIKGIIKKIMIFVFIAIARRLDLLLDTTFIMNSSIIAFTLNELLSIIQNSAKMGFDVPKIFDKAIELLKQKMEVK